jgi:hypothetical protein
MIPKKHAHILFGLILSGLMSCIVSGIATFRAIGAATGFLHFWGGAWITSWAVAFPTVLVVAPLARRIVRHLTRD